MKVPILIPLITLIVILTAVWYIYQIRETPESNLNINLPCVTPSPIIPPVKKPVGEIIGRVLFSDKGEACGVKITIFNGFDNNTVEVYTQADGSFKAPIIKSSKEGIIRGAPIYISIFATYDGYLPFVKNIPVTEKIHLSDIILEPLTERSRGVLTGVFYQPIRGGKIRRVYGIHQYVKNAAINLEDEAGNLFKTSSGEEGVFKLLLPPGNYRMMEVPILKRGYQINILEGVTTIFNIGRPSIMVD
ncbi:MAG: hypothetical protein QXQ02_08490 [Halobacteria archaeon]